MDFTRTYHRTSYPAISPTDTKNSQAGRTVLITGSTGGIGFATARAFLAAGADTVVVTGRNGDRLRASVKELESVGVVEEKQQGLAEDPSDHGSRGRVVGLPLDISEPSSVMALWTDLANQNIAVDTLVLNAATLSSTADRDRPPAVSEIWRKFQVNVLSSLQMTEHFLSQQSPISSSSRPRQRLLVNLTTARAHANPQSVHDGYGPSKVAITKAFEALADHTPTADLRVHNVNPGIIRTEASLRFGMDQDWMFDDGEYLFPYFFTSKAYSMNQIPGKDGGKKD